MSSKELNEIFNKTRRTKDISLTPEQVEELIKDLEELELYKKVVPKMREDGAYYKGQYYKQQGILEILKNKRVNINKIIKVGKLENYNSICAIETDLTFEEYKAIKNWLERKE